jgi:hypothetical protein
LPADASSQVRQGQIASSPFATISRLAERLLSGKQLLRVRFRTTEGRTKIPLAFILLIEA